MTKEDLERKLTAILSADVVGYSRLMGEDDEYTVNAIITYRKIIGDLIEKFHGRVVDAPGDNILAEFGSSLNAVRSAIEIQKALKIKNSELPENRRVIFRIGINLGDILHKEDRIYGDGVNIAARIESLADSGGICVSRGIFEQVEGKLDVGFNDLGLHSVKNINKPINIYKLLLDPKNTGKVFALPHPKKTNRQWMTIAVIVLMILIGGTGIWYYRSMPEIESVSVDSTVKPLTEAPSIAVLPFINLSDDQDQEYFSDGITNDIITDLSKFGELFVIASNSVFVYKGKSVNVQEVNRELGARYILEGSTQRSSEKVRVNAQLIDATSGHHIWAERYERDLKDLFALQDEIVQTIVETLAVKIDAEERVRVLRKETKNLKAYDYVLRGREYSSLSTRSANIKARQMFERAIELDPMYAGAYVGLGRAHMERISYGWTEHPGQTLQVAHDFAQKALTLDTSNASTHGLLGIVYRYRGQYDLAIGEYERAIELNPNDARTKAFLGMVMNYNSQPDEAIKKLKNAIHLDPKMSPASYMHLGLAYYLEGRYEDSVNTLKRGLDWYPDHVFIHIPLAAAYAQLGQVEESKHSATTVLRLHPFFEVDSFGNAFINPSDSASIADGLRKAGLQ